MSGRRDFLRGLVSLPLIGGGVTLIGQPTAVAAPTTPDMLEAYKTWLEYERRFLCWEMAADPVCRARYHPFERTDRVGYFDAIDGCFAHIGDSGKFHRGDQGQQPSARAALTSTVGCDWREDGR